MIPAAILAGGRAARLGGIEKCLAPLGDGVILYAILQSLAPQAAPLLLNSNSAPELFSRLALQVLPDVVAGQLGPLAGIFTALRWAEKLGARQVVTVPGDTPFLPSNFVAQLTATQSGYRPVIAASDDGLYPVIGLWPVCLAVRLEADLTAGIRAVHRWATNQEATVVTFAAGNTHLFANNNTPEELAQAQLRYADLNR